jgi:hypothetical protein
MKRIFETLGLTAMAVVLPIVAAVPVASAQQGMLTSDGPVTMIGSQTGTLFSNSHTGPLGTATCAGGTATGHKVVTHAETTEGKSHELVPSGSTTFTITSHSFNCQVHIPVLGTRPITVTQNGCDVVGHIGQTTGGSNTYGVTADLVCPAGKVAETHVYKAGLPHSEANQLCLIKVGSQAGLSGLHITATPASGDFDLQGTLSGVHTENSGSLCGTGTSTNTQLHFDVTINGLNAAGGATQVQITE